MQPLRGAYIAINAGSSITNLQNTSRSMADFAPFAHPLYVMTKPVGSSCNLRCDYCYYLEKEHLYPQQARLHEMSDDLLKRFTREYIEAQTSQDVLFTWHGGEPLMRSIGFYRHALKLQRKYARGRRIDNCIQTNGTLITEEWARFFRQHNWLVGVSIDGPKEQHDVYRKNTSGRPTHDRIMERLRILDRFGVQWNAMATVNSHNIGHPLEFYRFFKDIGCHYLQFSPIVERTCRHDDGRHLAAPFEQADDGKIAPYAVDNEAYGRFLCAIFDEWVREDVGKVFVQMFDATLACWMGVQPGICSMAKTCGHAGVIEYNGDVYSCDHFVFPEYRLGNIKSQTLAEMMYSDRQRAFGQAKHERLPRQCKECKFLFACNGGCPKDRFLTTIDGERGLNYLCPSFKKFFAHVAPYMNFMKNELMLQRPPANVMAWARMNDTSVEEVE